MTLAAHVIWLTNIALIVTLVLRVITNQHSGNCDASFYMWLLTNIALISRLVLHMITNQHNVDGDASFTGDYEPT